MPVVEASTGSLGQGLSIAQGIALALRHQKRSARSFCVIGDGECQEGQIWEAVMSAPKFKLNNLVVFLDNNNGQIDGHVTDVMDINPIPEKFRAFKWAVHDVNGHDFEQLVGALEAAKQETEKPTMIVCRTVKLLRSRRETADVSRRGRPTTSGSLPASAALRALFSPGPTRRL